MNSRQRFTSSTSAARQPATLLGGFRKLSPPIASATLFFFAESALAPAVAWAQPDAQISRSAGEEKLSQTNSADKAEAAPPDGPALRPDAADDAAGKGAKGAPLSVDAAQADVKK